MFSTDEFKDWTDKVIPFAHITTRVPGDPDQGLLYEKGGRGFPTLAFLDADGHMLAKPRGRSVEAFSTALDGAVQDFFELQKRAKDDKEAGLELLKKEVELGRIDDFDKMRKRIAKAKLSDDEKAKLLTEVDTWFMNRVRGLGSSGKVAEAMKMADGLIKDGKVPEGRDGLMFWYQYGQWAAETKDRKRLNAAIKAAEASDDRSASRVVQLLKGMLEKL